MLHVALDSPLLPSSPNPAKRERAALPLTPVPFRNGPVGTWARHEPLGSRVPTQAEVDQVASHLAGQGGISLRELRLRWQQLTGVDLSARKDDIKRMAEISVLTLAQGVRHASPHGNACCPDLVSQHLDAGGRGRELFRSVGDITDEACGLFTAVQVAVGEPLPEGTCGWTDVTIGTLGLRDRGCELSLSLRDASAYGATFTCAWNNIVDEVLRSGMEVVGDITPLMVELPASVAPNKVSMTSDGPNMQMGVLMGEHTVEFVSSYFAILASSGIVIQVGLTNRASGDGTTRATFLLYVFEHLCGNWGPGGLWVHAGFIDNIKAKVHLNHGIPNHVIES